MSGYVDKRFSSCYAGAKRRQIFNKQRMTLKSPPKALLILTLILFCSNSNSSGVPFVHKYSNASNMSKNALVFLGPGAEEMEFVIAADVLRRGGIQVTVAGLPDSAVVKCSRDVNIKPDIGVSEAKGPYDVLVLPGGLGGSKAMAESEAVGELLKEQEKAGRWIAAICAAPTALKAHHVAEGKTITCYPAMRAQMEEGGKYKYKEDKVIVDGNVITSRGPGTAFDFALVIVDKLVGKEKASEELGDIRNSGLKFFRDIQVDETNILTWQGLIVPDSPPYNKGAFKIEINFPAEYPFKPPKINFKTKIYHPNIDEKGQVCLPIISAENWKPATKTDQASLVYENWCQV
ncbi:hypothetical protein D910_10361 [Dendroctonus ponderosae]|uniref:Ubiquitin-conjugating enzyme E2-18 kDa n=1 Tax=Dendroctonus ponderosae TaxID=77166 RepID=U4UGF5_DENPD|nr:hypothetical protein D910_10361 [Dendroctonus ponderosae]